MNRDSLARLDRATGEGYGLVIHHLHLGTLAPPETSSGVKNETHKLVQFRSHYATVASTIEN